MSPDKLRAWRRSLGISQAEAARRLRVSSTRVYERWEAGTRRPPEHLDLACAAVAQGLPPWTRSGAESND